MTASTEFVADLHIHSRYAYACSKSLTLGNIAETARLKGLQLLATGDFTHPAWLSELGGRTGRGGLRDIPPWAASSLYWVLKSVASLSREAGPGGVHLLLYLPSFESARRFQL